MKTIKELWQERSQKYGKKIEGVLPKSFPPLVNGHLDKWMYQCLAEIIEKKKKLNILDVGCGYGRLSKKVLSDFPNVSIFGIDIAKRYVDIYNQELNPRGKAIYGDFLKLPFPNSYFDLCFMVTTLMYVTDKDSQKKAVGEFLRVLKPNGKFLIIERNTLGNSIVTLGGLISRLRGSKHQEITSVSFSPGYLVSIIEENGGKILEKKGIPIWSLFLLPIILLSITNGTTGRFCLLLVGFLDKIFSRLLTPSLYISYSGTK